MSTYLTVFGQLVAIVRHQDFFLADQRQSCARVRCRCELVRCAGCRSWWIVEPRSARGAAWRWPGCRLGGVLDELVERFLHQQHLTARRAGPRSLDEVAMVLSRIRFRRQAVPTMVSSWNFTIVSAAGGHGLWPIWRRSVAAITTSVVPEHFDAFPGWRGRRVGRCRPASCAVVAIRLVAS